MKTYRRDLAIAYAKQWAYGRNDKYYAFDTLGGDCTNFISQCLYEGSGVMNYTPVLGWFYTSLNNRSPAWTGVEFLYRFLTENKGPGPFGEPADITDIMPGDIIQLKFEGLPRFTHSLMVSHKKIPVTPGNIFVTAHDRDCFHCSLNQYTYSAIRYLRVVGVNP